MNPCAPANASSVPQASQLSLGPVTITLECHAWTEQTDAEAETFQIIVQCIKATLVILFFFFFLQGLVKPLGPFTN